MKIKGDSRLTSAGDWGRLFTSFIFFLCLLPHTIRAQQATISGTVVDYDSRQPVAFVSVALDDNTFWAISDAKGQFSIRNVPLGKTTLTVQCLGYATRQMTLHITKDIPKMHILLKHDNLKLDEVTVTARRKTDNATTSYTIDRKALDQQQLLNVGDIGTLLPGGKTVNPTLMNDSRLALRSGSSEQGNAAFGTAVEIDGMRLDNNAAVGETTGVSTRTVSASNIESVEVVTGIPSVEYGDLSNGMVKVKTRRGQSPFIIEGSLTQHTRQVALNKGFNLGADHGVLNVSLEHARSFSNAASPYTAYQRNILSLHYMNTYWHASTPLTLNVGLTGNIGGYNSEADPDEELGDYTKKRDNTVRAHFELNWLLNKPYITNLSLRGHLSYANQTTHNYQHTNSATTLAYIHTQEEGYNLAVPFDTDPTAPVVLGPTGYWNVMQHHDSKPLSYALRLKGVWTHRFGKVLSKLLAGAEYTGSRNNGRGTYYEEPRYTPTWREYRYDALPTLNNVALYAEERVSIPTTKLSTMELTAGLRQDITLISGSDYGTAASLSPRFNSRYIFWQNRRSQWLSDLSVHAGWGKSVKLPSFQVLYPSPSYYDIEVFNSPSTADNTTISGYYTHPSKAQYNPDLKWQYTHQTDLGFELKVKGTRLSLSAFRHQTFNPYMATRIYSPFSYVYTPVSAIPAGAVGYAIDHTTGQVTATMADASVQTLNGYTRRTYLSNYRYTNGTAVNRYGLEWMLDFAQIKSLRTAIRLDGNYYYYKGVNDMLFADMPASTLKMTGTNEPYQYVGWYRGTNATSGVASASVANGALSRALNLNTTVTTHIPKIRLIVALRVEASLYNYRKALCEYDNGLRGIALADKADYQGVPYDGSTSNQYVAVYPEYYSTWENPDDRMPFAETFLWARDHDATLYNDLCNLVVRSNNPYLLNDNRISSYYSANLTVTKEIGDHVSLSFYANNFFNNMKLVHSSQTDQKTSLFSSSYIPSYYYGLSLRLKL